MMCILTVQEGNVMYSISQLSSLFGNKNTSFPQEIPTNTLKEGSVGT